MGRHSQGQHTNIRNMAIWHIDLHRDGIKQGSQVGQEKLQFSISKIKRTMSSNDNTHIMEVAKIFMSYIEVPGMIHVPYPRQVESM